MKCVFTGIAEEQTELDRRRQALLVKRALAAIRRESLRQWTGRSKVRYIVKEA